MPLTELKRFSTTIWKDASASDDRQVPAGSATVAPHYRGATVSSSQSIAASPATATVNVYDIGALAVGDTLAVGTGSTTMSVSSITSATAVVLQNTTAGTIQLTTGNRLRITNRTPTVYSNVTGTVSVASPATDGNGLIEFYSNERFFDYMVSGSGLTTTLYQDAESGQVWAGRTYYDVRSFKDVATAIAAIPADSTLFFPPGFYEPPTAAGWTISKRMRILGSGSQTADATNTVFRPYNSVAAGGAPNSTVFTVSGGTDTVSFENFIIFPQNAPTSTGTGDGIYFDAVTTQINYSRIKDVKIYYMGRDGIRAVANAPTTYWNEVVLENIYIANCRNNGIRIVGAADVFMYNVGVIGCGDAGLYCDGCGGLVATDFRTNGNGQRQAGGNLSDPMYSQGEIVLRTTHAFTFNSLDMEGWETINISKIGLNLENCRSGVIINPRVYNVTSVANTAAIYASDNNEAIAIFGGHMTHTHYAVYVMGGNRGNRGWIVQAPAITGSDATTPGLINIPQQNSGAATASGGHIVFPTMDRSGTGTVEDSFIAGIELPSVNGVATIGNPQLKDGLLVFDSATGKLNIRSGGAWVVVGTQS